MLARLIDKFESYQRSGYDFSKLPDNYVSSMLGGIVGFEMQIESLEGKFKLGQERSDGDKQGVLDHLRQAAPRERSGWGMPKAPRGRLARLRSCGCNWPRMPPPRVIHPLTPCFSGSKAA